MKIPTIDVGRKILTGVCTLAVIVLLCGCPPAEKEAGENEAAGPLPPLVQPAPSPEQPAELRSEPRPEPGEKTPAETLAQPDTEPEEMVGEAVTEAAEEKPRDLGPPLVDNPEQLTRLSPKEPVWIDMRNKRIVLLGEVCEAGYPLEFFATYSNRAYESVVAVNVTPLIVHAGLLRIGAEPGHPARFEPEFEPPTGTEVAIEVRWKDERGKVQSAPAQHWIRHIKTKKELDVNWVFAGSFFRENEQTGEEYYAANSGELVCVLNLPGAMLDLPIRSFGAIEARSFEAFEEHLPPAGTPTTLLLKPILDEEPGAEKPAPRPAPEVDEKINHAKRIARRAAEAWLDLIDRGQYSRGWETASQRLNIISPRRDFIRMLNETRKPLGKLISRNPLPPRYTRSIPNAPDGQYVVIRYETKFENNADIVEEVTLTLNGDNKWRVLGYRFQ